MNTLTIEQMKSLVGACTYKPGWEIIFDNDGERPFVQIAATTLCSVSGEASAWKSGKTYLSPYMCRQEVVSAVYGAIEKAELHEIREFFRYKGASIFNPHLDPDVLAEVAKKKESFNMRDNAMTMEEKDATLPYVLVPTGIFKFTLTRVEKSKQTIYTCSDVNLADERVVSWVDDEGQLHTVRYREEAVVRMLQDNEWKIIN